MEFDGHDPHGADTHARGSFSGKVSPKREKRAAGVLARHHRAQQHLARRAPSTGVRIEASDTVGTHRGKQPLGRAMSPDEASAFISAHQSGNTRALQFTHGQLSPRAKAELRQSLETDGDWAQRGDSAAAIEILTLVFGGGPAGKGSVVAGKAIVSRLAAQFGRRGAAAGARGGDEAFHYTYREAVQSIEKEGLRPGSFATSKGGLSPLQAQIDLALPPNRGLRDAVVRIDLAGLRRAGYEVPRFTRVGRKFNMPGGGSEVYFQYSIPPRFLRVIPR